jgi:rubrerythrin
MAWEQKDVLEILQKAMQLETEGRQFYDKAAEISKDPAGKKMFLSFAQDEADHYAKLHRQYESIAGTGKWLAATELLTREPARWQVSSVFPTEDHEVSAAVGADANDVEALQIALKAEKESYDLYTQSAEKVEDQDAKALFSYLAAEEMGHYQLLDSALDYLGNASSFFLIEEGSINEG